MSSAVLAGSLLEGGRFYVLAPPDVSKNQLENFEWGGVVDEAAAIVALGQILTRLRGRGAACLIVEDNLGLRTDPAVVQSDVRSAFLGDRVVCWADLTGEADSGRGAAEMTRVSNGYPLNAFVVSRSSAELGLAADAALGEAFTEEVVQSLLAVVIAAFDAESFLVWEAR